MLEESPSDHFFDICGTNKVKRGKRLTLLGNSGGDTEGSKSIGEEEVEKGVDGGLSDVGFLVESANDDRGIRDGLGSVRKGGEI